MKDFQTVYEKISSSLLGDVWIDILESEDNAVFSHGRFPAEKLKQTRSKVSELIQRLQSNSMNGADSPSIVSSDFIIFTCNDTIIALKQLEGGKNYLWMQIDSSLNNISTVLQTLTEN